MKESHPFVVDEVASTCLIASQSSALCSNVFARMLAICAKNESACLSIRTCFLL